MAKLVVDPKKLPERAALDLPGAKPAVYSLPYQDRGKPEEADDFRNILREIRRQASPREK